MASVSTINCLTNIKNGVARELESVDVVLSKGNVRLLEVLARGRLIRGYKFKKYHMRVLLMNSDIVKHRFKTVCVCSKPSKPCYVNVRVLRKIYSRLGSSIESLTILSTTQGFMTISEALRGNLGGELLFGASGFVKEAMGLAR